jgi:hypothetical protein
MVIFLFGGGFVAACQIEMHLACHVLCSRKQPRSARKHEKSVRFELFSGQSSGHLFGQVSGADSEAARFSVHTAKMDALDHV